MLTHVRVVRSGAWPEIVETAEAETVSAVSHSPAADVVDCTEPRRAAPRAPELTSTLSSAAAADVGPKFLETACGGRNAVS